MASSLLKEGNRGSMQAQRQGDFTDNAKVLGGFGLVFWECPLSPPMDGPYPS
jgi:hypothetical protein